MESQSTIYSFSYIFYQQYITQQYAIISSKYHSQQINLNRTEFNSSQSNLMMSHPTWVNIAQETYQPFKSEKLTVVKGKIPKNLKGRLFRNQPATLSIDQQPIAHWFNGNGSILSITFDNGACEASFQHIETPLYKYIQQNRKERPGIIETIFRFFTFRKLDSNSANTSVYPIPNSPELLAVCQGGFPFALKKDTLQSLEYRQYGIKKAYSAHYKIDPDTQYLYNFGMGSTPKYLHVYKHTPDMKLLQTNQITLRDYQSIHDCALAGDYLVLFQYPISFDLKRMMMGKPVLTCFKYDSEKYPNTIVHVFRKSDLSHVRKYDAPSFFSFHFVNGEQKGNTLELEFVKYPDEYAGIFFNYLTRVPEYAINKNLQHPEHNFSNISKITLNLDDGKLQMQDFQEEYSSQFPVISDNLIGKTWRFSYHALATKGKPNFTRIGIYDREERKYTKVHSFGSDDDIYVSEPVLIENGETDYLLAILYRGTENKCYAELLDAKDLREVVSLELPGIVPPSFHGKWDYSEIK